jgi:hypothetical protein
MEGDAVSGLERFVFDAKRRRFVLFEEIEGEAAEDGESFYGVSSSDARVILYSAIALVALVLQTISFKLHFNLGIIPRNLFTLIF